MLAPGADPLPVLAQKDAAGEAMLLFERGRYYTALYNNRHAPADAQVSEAALRRALELDPDLAEAAAELALLRIFRFEGGEPAEPMVEEGRALAQRALAIDRHTSNAWVFLFWAAQMSGGTLREQLEYALRAAAAGPRNGLAMRSLAGSLPAVSLSLEAAVRALAVDPLYVYGAVAHAWYLAALDRLEEAVAVADGVLEREPSLGFVLDTKLLALVRLGRLDEAREALNRLEAMSLAGGYPEHYLGVARHDVLWAAGEERAAREVSARIRSAIESPPTSGFDRELACQRGPAALARSGQTDAALDLLELCPPRLHPLRQAARKLRLRSPAWHPRFEAVASRSREQLVAGFFVLEQARARGELPAFLEEPLERLRVEYDLERPPASLGGEPQV